MQQYKSLDEMKNIFEKTFKNEGFSLLKEKSLIDTKGENDFNTSLLVAQTEEILDSKDEFIFSTQRSFYPSSHDGLTRSPLLSFWHTMCNFYIKDIKNIDKALHYSKLYLKMLTNENEKKIFIFIDKSTFNMYKGDFLKYFEEEQFQFTENKNNYTFNFNNDTVIGEYIKFFIEYKDGIMPIFDFVFMNYKDEVIIEAGALLERGYFVSNNLSSIYDTDIYKELFIKTQEYIGNDYFTSSKDYIGYYSLHMARSLSIVMLDGLNPSNKNPSTKKMRFWMKFLLIRMKTYFISPTMIYMVLDEVFTSIKLSGYEYKESAYDRVKLNWEKEILKVEKDNTIDLIEIKREPIRNATLNKIIKIKNKKTLQKDELKYSNAYPFEDDDYFVSSLANIKGFSDMFL